MPASYHVIVADDDAAIRSVIVRVIARIYPFATISEVADGLTALSIYQQHGADLVITNHQMPVMNGLILTERLCVLNSTLPIIMVSAHPIAEPLARAAGVTHFLLKPFSIAELVRIVTSVLSP
jgi:CheY-like chemotaxis protein